MYVCLYVLTFACNIYIFNAVSLPYKNQSSNFAQGYIHYIHICIKIHVYSYINKWVIVCIYVHVYMYMNI